MESGNKDIVIIGAGISGLLSALVLSNNGHKVTILEKTGEVGGVCRSYNVDGYTIDTGPHIITRLEDGPLRILFDKYIKDQPGFTSHGEYFVRSKSKLRAFPWTLRTFAMFDLIPKLDRIELMQTLISLYSQRALGRLDEDMSVAQAVQNRSLESSTMQFLDVFCKFMTGADIYKTPIARFFDSQDYKNKKNTQDPLDYFNGVKNLIMKKGALDQQYPYGGIRSLISAICESFPEGNVTLKCNCPVTRIQTNNGKVCGVDTRSGHFPADVIIYSSYASDLPDIIDVLPDSYSDSLRKLEKVLSLTLWLGFDSDYFTIKGSEVWIDTDPPLWVVPTSLYDPSLAPEGRQLAGFTTTISPDANIDQEKQRLYDAVCSRLDDVSSHIDMIHWQVLVPEKAAWVVGQKMPSCRTPVNGLYLVGTDTTRKSMGVTRSAYSILNLQDALADDGII